MATPKYVTGKITDLSGNPRGGALVKVLLSQACTIPGTQEIVPTAVNAVSDATGAWTVQLYATNDMTPGATYDTVYEDGNQPFTIQVPQGTDSGGHAGTLLDPFRVTLLLTAPPVPAGSPSTISALTVTDGPVVLPVASVADEALSENVALLNENNVFTASQTLNKATIHPPQTPTEAVLVSGIDASLSEEIQVTLTASRVMGVPLNGVAGQHLRMVITEGGAGGFALTFGAGITVANFGLNMGVGAKTVAQLSCISAGQWVIWSPSVSGTDITPRSVSVGSSPNTATLPGAPSIPTPAGVTTGKVLDYGGATYNVMAFGAKGDAKCLTDAVMTNGSPILTSASNPFASTDVGKLVAVPGAGAAGVPLFTTILSYQSAGQVTLAASASTSVSSATAAPATFGTDDTAAIQAAITLAQTEFDEVMIPSVPVGYCTSAALVVSSAANVTGNGVKELFGSIITYPNSVNIPAIAPYLTGAVIIPMTSGQDGWQFTGTGLTQNMANVGVRFGGLYKSTGHGFNTIPTVDGANFDTGTVGSEWFGLKVYGHDGNHVGFRIINPFYISIYHPRSYGGGGLFFRGDTVRTSYGNVVCIHPYVVQFINGSANGIELQANTVDTLNLMRFIRPQSWVWSTTAGNPMGTAIPGVTAPANTVLPFKVDANVSRIEWDGIDSENNVGASNGNLGVRAQFTSSAKGAPSNAILFMVPDHDSEIGVMLRSPSVTFNGAFFKWLDSTGAALAQVDSAGLLDLSPLAATAIATGAGLGDKISLYQSGATGVGLGLQSNRLVAYMPVGTGFAVRVASGSGAASSGSDVVVLKGNGDITNTGNLIPTGNIQLLNNISISQKDGGGTLRSILGGFANILYLGAQAGWTQINFQGGASGKDMIYSSAGLLTVAAGIDVLSAGARLRNLAAFVAADKYVVADSNGNLHLSALGPAS